MAGEDTDDAVIAFVTGVLIDWDCRRGASHGACAHGRRRHPSERPAGIWPSSSGSDGWSRTGARDTPPAMCRPHRAAPACDRPSVLPLAPASGSAVGRRRVPPVTDQMAESRPLSVVVSQGGNVSERARGEKEAPLRTVEPVDVREDVGRQTEQAQELADPGTGHAVPASQFGGVLDLAGDDHLLPRPGAGERIDDPWARVARGPSTWPAASGDGTQQESPSFTGDDAWHAALSGRGPLERAPSSGGKSDGLRWLLEDRGPPGRGCTGRPGCVWLPGRGMSTSQPVRTRARSAGTKMAPQAGLEPATLRLTAGKGVRGRR